MAESKKIELSENVTLSFLGNETINEVNLYKYEAKIKNVEKTKTIYLEKEASKYDKTILSDYIIRMVEEYDDQDAFFIVSNGNSDDNKEETDSLNNNKSDSKTEETSNAGGGSGGGSESYGGSSGKTYSDDTVELFQGVAKNAGEFDGSNLDAYKFDLSEFIAFKPSVDRLKFISLGELPSAKSSLGQAAVKASEGGCDEAVGMIEELKAEIESKQIEDAMDAQVQFYQEVDEIELEQMQRDDQLNFENNAVTFNPSKYIVSEQEYKDGMRNVLSAQYESLADYVYAKQNYRYKVESSVGNLLYKEVEDGLKFSDMTDAEKAALAKGEDGTIDFDKNMLAKLGLDSTTELLDVFAGFKSAGDLEKFLNSIGDNDVRLATNEYANKLINSRWYNAYWLTEEGKNAFYDKFVNDAKENPNRTAKYDEYDAVINTEYVNYCMLTGQEKLLIPELASRPLILRIINDETGIFGKNISYYANIEDEELIASYEKYAKENDGNYPPGVRKNGDSLQQKTYTLIGEQWLYEMDYHADEWKANYNPEKKKYTAFSQQARYDAEVRSNRGEFIENYEKTNLNGDAERDWAILNGQIEDKARLAELKENGCLSFEDNYKILQIISASGNEELLAKINEVGINGLDKKDKNTFDTILKNAGYNDNQLWNFKLKYGSDDNDNITTYIEDHHQNLLDKIKELEIREHQSDDLTKEEKEKLNEMRKQADVLSKMDENSYNNLSEEEKETFSEMLKQAGFSGHEISNYETGANSNSIDNAYQTYFSTRLTTDIIFLKGVAKFVENCRDAGITISNNNFWLLLNSGNGGAIKETKKYKEMQQELYDEVMSTYKESGAYDRDYEAFINSNSFDKDIIDYLVTNGYERDTLRLKQAKIDDLEEMKKLNPDGSASYNMEIENVKSEIEKLYQEAFLDAKVKELNLGDANASSQMSAAFRYGVRTGDFTLLYEYENDEQMLSMANSQYSAMLDVAVDNVGNWVQGNIYEKDWYQAAEDASLVKKDNFLGICVDQIGNMAIPIGLSMVIPGIGGALGATSATSTAALGALAKAASSTALWTSAFGGASEEAFSQGANYGDATKYALLSATTELATEWMFSGIMGFGTGWYDNALKSMFGKLDKTLGNLSSKIIKNPKTRAIIEKLIISGIGEGTEEVITDLITPLWRSWTLEKENSYLDILHRDVSFESLVETFSIAFVTSLFFSGMSINGQKRNLNKNIESLSRITESNPAFNEALRNMSSELFAQIIENDGRLSQREIFSEVIGKFREQIMADPQLREAMDQANAELLKDVIKTDANNNITNMQEVIERLFNDNLLENATAEDISTIENVLTKLAKSNTNITAEQIYQELLNSDSKLIAENFAKASQLNETTKNFIKSFTENSFSYEFKDGSKIDLSQSLLSEIAELDQTLHSNSFEINNGELVVKNENKFRKLIEHAAKDRISNLKYQNNLFRKKLGLLNDIDADTIENALYFMDQDSTIAHYTNDNVILEYNGKSINVPVNLAVQIANEIRLDNYIKDGKLVFKSEYEMKTFVNKTCELGAKAIENINKRIDTTPNKTLEDALNINNNRINMEADKNALIINRVVLEDGIVAYDVIMENKSSESDVINENDTGIRRKIIYTTEENLKNVFNEKGLAQDVIDLMNQNEDAPNIYLELTNEQVENIEKRIRNEQEKAKEKSNAIEEKETTTGENTNEKMIQERAETREQQTNENEAVDNKDTNVRENIVERNDSSTSEATRVKVRTRENTSTNVNENTNAGENIVERNDSSTREATRVKVRTRENASTDVNETAKASERVDVAQRNNATQTNADVIRNTASAATVVINAVANNANRASIVVDAPVQDGKTSNREAQGVQNNQNNQNAQNNQNDTANDIKNGFDAMGNGVREAGRRRVMELVQKNGYVAYRNENAARLFEQNPEYKDWRHEVVDGEHRFYPPGSNQNGEVIHTIDEGTIRNTQTVLETNSEIEVIKPENAEQNINQKFKRGFDPSLSYEGFDYVVKPKTSFEQALNEVIANNNGSNIVIEINNTTELTLDLIEQIPDNVKVRVTGDYNVDFMNTFKLPQQSGNGTLRNVTYTKEQLKSIMTEIYEFEKGIDPNWSDMEKARYAYDYLKNSIEYHDVKQIHELSSKEGMAGNNADRPARYDGLVNLIEKSSTCQGFAATYQELLTRMGIDARIVSGNLNGEGQHVYDVVKIDGKTFIVDSVREMLDANSPGKYTGSGFNVENIFEYHAKSSYQELIKESVLTQISENIDGIIEKGVYNNMNLEELSDFIKDNYSETQIPNNLKEFIHQVDEFKLDKAANEVEVEDIHIDEYADRINEEQVSSVEVLNRAKEDLAKLRGGAAGIISKFLKANAVVLTTIADPSLGIGSTITYNMVAQQILNGEFVANNKATEIMKETTLKILTWGYGKEQKTQIRNQIKYIEQVRMDLIEQGIDLDVSRSKKIQNIISDKTKVVKENIKNVYGNVKARFNNNVKTNEIVVNETSMSNEIVNNRNSRINELIDMSRNGTDIHYEYRTSSDTSLKEVQKNIVNVYENNSKAIVLDSGSWTHIHIGSNPNITLDNAIKIYVPIDGTNADVVTKQVLDFLLENNIASRNKVGSHVKGDAFVLRIFDKTDAKRVINFINEQVKLNPLTGKEMPLTFKAGGVSVAMDGLTSYNKIATILIDNFAKNNLGTDINGFKEFVHALNEQIINGDVDLFETMFKDQIRNLEENPYINNEQLAKANVYEVIDIIDKALNNNMNANEFIDYISEYQNTSKVNDVINRITGTEVINENSNNQNRVVKPNIVKTFITKVNEKFRVVRNNIGEKFRIAKENVNQFKADLKAKLEIRRAENSHISADTSNVRIEKIKLQMNSLMETYNGKVDFIRESVIKTLEYKNIPVTEENIRTNLEQVLNGNYNVITSREGLRQQVINASNEIKYCTNELSRLSLEISANESGSIIMNAIDLRLDNIIKNANEIGSHLYSEYVEMHFEDMFEDIWRDVEGYFEQNSYDNLVVERWTDGSFLNFTIGQQKHSAFGNAVKMYIPINHANASYMVKTIIEQLAKNNIASDNKISRIARSDAFVLRIYDVNDAYRVANWINNNFNLEATGSELPLCYKFGKIGIAMDGRTSYNSIVTQLIRFYSQNYTQNLDVNGFKDFVRNLKENVILNKNTDILETVFDNYFVDLKERYMMEYKYDKNYAKANAYANLYEIVDIVDAILNGNMSPVDFFRYLNEYTKPAKVGNIITNLSSSQINEDATVNQTSSESVVINNNQTTIEETARLIASNNEYLLAAIRYQEMSGHQLHDLLVETLDLWKSGKINISNEMRFLLDEFAANNGVLTNEIIEGVKQALLYTQNKAANNFGLEIGKILENMGYERIMEKFGVSEETLLNVLSDLYNNLLKAYKGYGLTEEQLNKIFAKIKFRTLDEMRRIYHKSDVTEIGGVNILGTSYINLGSRMNTRFEIFLENVYHECTHAIGRIVQREINGYQIDGIINEYFTDLQAKKAGGFLESEAYIPRLVNILEEIERIIDPSRELFTQVYVEGNFSSLVDRLTELTGDENLANKLAREIVETIETTHKNMRNAIENKQFFMKNYYAQQAEAFVDYLKQQLNNNANQVNTNNSQNINENTSNNTQNSNEYINQESNNNVEEIEMIDESTIENRGVLEGNDVVDVIKVEPTKKTKVDLGAREFNINDSYEGYKYVVKAKNGVSLEQVINEVIKTNDGSNILIEINNTTELTLDLINKIPDNVKVRVIGNYTEEYMKGFKRMPGLSGLGTLKNVTYTKEQLTKIMERIYEFEKGINPNWTDTQKAEYAYNWLRKNMQYHDKKLMYEFNNRAGLKGSNADRLAIYDGLANLIGIEIDGKQVMASTCQGFAATYQELLTRMGIEAYNIAGGLNGEGGHGFNIIKIDGKTFIVDPVREFLNENSPGYYPGTGFKVANINQYYINPHMENYKLLQEAKLTQINQISENLSEIIYNNGYNNMNLVELCDYIKNNFSEENIPDNVKELIRQIDEINSGDTGNNQNSSSQGTNNSNNNNNNNNNNDNSDNSNNNSNDNNSDNNNDSNNNAGNNSSNNMNKMENANAVEERFSSREDLNANQSENANFEFDKATNDLISEYEKAKAKHKEILKQYDTTTDVNERYDLEDEIGILYNKELRLAKEIVDTLNINDLFKANNNDLLNDYIGHMSMFYINESKYNDFIKSIYDIYQKYNANNDLSTFLDKINDNCKALLASNAFDISNGYLDMCRDLIMNGPKIDIQNIENYTNQEIVDYLTFKRQVILNCGKYLDQFLRQKDYIEFFDSIDKVSEYARNKGISFYGIPNTDVYRNAMKLKENYGVVARNRRVYEGNVVGANQGAVRKALWSGNPKLIKPLIEQVKNNYPNLTTMDAIRFLKIIECGITDLGVCNYAIFVNAILEANHIDVAMLEEKLGYKLFENGKLNDARLLADIFTKLNPNFIGEMGKYNHKMAKNNKGYINLGVIYNSGFRAVQDSGLNLDAMNKFFREKNIPVVAKSDNLVEDNSINDLTHEQKRNYIINRVAEALKNGDCPCLILDGHERLYNSVINVGTKLGSAHIVTIFGINENGDLRVDSWGKEYIVKASDLANDEIVRLYSLRLEQVESFDNIEKQIENERINNVERTKEIRMPYARSFETGNKISFFGNLEGKVKIVKNDIKNIYGNVRAKLQSVLKTKTNNGIAKSNNQDIEIIDESTIGKYKYKKGQIFGKKLPVPDDIISQVYTNTLPLNDFLNYELYDKIPTSCLNSLGQQVVEKFGLEKVKQLDIGLLNSLTMSGNVEELLLNIDSSAIDINEKLYDLVKDKIPPVSYPPRMKQIYKDRLFDSHEIDGVDYRSSNVMRLFNRGEISLQELVSNWDLFKDKNLDYCLKRDRKNSSGVTSDALKHFMDTYGTIVQSMDKVNIYEFISTFGKEKSPLNYICNSTASLKSFGLSSKVKTFIDQYGLKNITAFDDENGHILIKDNFKMLKLMSESSKFIMDAPKEFYGMVKETILTGELDYREITGEFRTRYANLFISKQAPKELQDLFYANSIVTSQLLQEHPEYVQYLKNVDLEAIYKDCPTIVTIDNVKANLAFAIKNIFGKEEGLSVLLEYGKYLDAAHKKIGQLVSSVRGSSFTKKVLLDEMEKFIAKGITEGMMYDENMPTHFKEDYPELFLDKNAPKELREVFYNRKINTQFITSNPNYIQYLESVDLEAIYSYMPVETQNGEMNLIGIIKQTFGEESLNLMLEYGKYIEETFNLTSSVKYKYSINPTKEQLLSEIDSTILEGIGAGMNYDENMPSHFKEKYPTLFLKQGISENIKNKFYSRQFTIEDFTENPELFELFENTSVICGLDQEYSWLIPLVNDFDNYNKLRFAQQYYRISNKRMRKVYKEYVEGHINDIDVTNIENIGEVLYRLSTSNSSEINRLMEGLATRILNTSNPFDTLDKVEDLFVKNNIPTVGKLYSCFEIFYPDFKKFSFSKDSKISPMLKKSSLIQKKFITFSDLIKAAFGSNNRSVNSYLKNIEIESELYRKIVKIVNDKLSYDSLSEIEKNELGSLVRHLSTLYESTLKGKNDNSEFISTGDVIKDISELSIKLSPNGTLDYNLADRIVKMFCGFSGIDTLEQAKSYISTKIETADVRNRETASKEILLEKGDLIKGVIDGLKYLGNILQSGLTSKEYVGAEISSDATPLDIDVSMVENNYGTIGDKINRSSAKSFGPIWFILKNDGRFVTTRDISGEIDAFRDTSKLELFYTGVWGEDHYGVRTGFASSEINYMVMEHYDPRVGLEIAMNGFYIPVVNFNGEVVFKPEDYDTLREKMAGLSYYDENNYEFSSNLITEGTMSIVPKLEQSNEEIHAKKTKIDAFLSKILGDYGLRMKTKIDGVLDTGSVELIDTGSTGRGTNKPSDGDFDFVMRLDKSILFDSKKLEDFQKELQDSMVADDKTTTAGGDFRFKGVQIDESLKVDLDISFVGKTDKITYSTDMALLDRLSTIKNIDQERYNYVVANIIFAKQFLKEAGCYKPYRSDAEQGGLGGVGVENWILQNGGSFIDAAKEFLENSRLISYSDYLRDNPNRTFKSYLKATKKISFYDFSQKYQIWDYGENHFTAKRQEADEQKEKEKEKEEEYYFHDNFVKGNMSEAGYEKMVEALEKYISKINISNADATAHRQQFYGEAIETPTKSLSHYERLLDDLKIGKKSLFEKVDTAIYRDLSTMKSYIARSEVSNTEAKFLTEKTFLRLAEKYWGNEDAMKILSDIVPSEGDTLRETIASIGDRVCEYELSMYEENASINEIHDVLDIPVKIIGNSSPILYLRLNEFEKAISRMPDNLKNILKTVDIKIYDTECFENASSSIGYFDTPKKRFAIYAGTIGNELRFYEHGASSFTGIPSIEYETITHELGHIIDNRLGNSEMSYTEMSDEWQRAMEADKLISNKDSVSDYGKTKVEEDFAESIKLYYRSAGFLKKNFPNRARLVEECINNMNVHSPTINAKTQNFYRSDTTLNTSTIQELLSSKNIELSDIANLDSTKPISKIKDELFEAIKSLDTPVDSKVIDRLTYLLDTYKTSNGSIYYKDVIGNDTYIITDNNVLFRVDNNEKSILDIVDYLSNMSNSERNNMFLSFYKDTARIVNSYDSDNINMIHRVLSRLFSGDTYYGHKTKYIDLYSDNNYGSKQDIIPYYLKDSSLKERLVKLVKSIYPGMDDINANRLLRHMEVTPTTDEGMCSYSVIANMIYEKYYGNSEAFLRDFSYEMSINSRLNSGELMADMYAYCNRVVLVNDNIVSTTNEEQVSLCDRKVSSMWNKLFNTDLINSFFKSKNINLEVSEEVLFDYYNIDGNTNSLSKNLFDGIISNIVKSLEQGKHVAIELSDFDIVVDGFEERISNNHVMSIVSVLDNGLLEVDSWGKKCYIDLKNITKSARQITISELSLNEK